jgi:hypothetical protein
MCPLCDYTEGVEPQIISQLVDTGRAYYICQHPFLDAPILIRPRIDLPWRVNAQPGKTTSGTINMFLPTIPV